jgi:hypothetical protein
MEKKKLGYFFHKMKIFPQKGAYQPMSMNMNHILVLERQLTSNLYFVNYSDIVQRNKVKKYYTIIDF